MSFFCRPGLTQVRIGFGEHRVGFYGELGVVSGFVVFSVLEVNGAEEQQSPDVGRIRLP